MLSDGGGASGPESPSILAFRHRLRLISVILTALGSVGGLAVFGMIELSRDWIALLEHGTVFISAALALSVLSLFVAQVDIIKWTREQVRLQVAERTLAFDGNVAVAPGGFRDAVAYSTGTSRHGVRARTRWRTFYFDVESREQADRIVSTLGLDSRHAVADFRAPNGVALVAAIMALFAVGGWTPGLAIMCGAQIGPWIHRFLTIPRCVVGTDGVLVEKGFGLSKRFIPYAEMQALSVDGANLTITLSDWTLFVIKSEDDAKRSRRPVVGANALKARIEGARASAGTSRAAEVAGDLARGERDVATWLSAVRQLGEARATFRDAAVRREGLWNALEAGTQPAEVRVGAAVALQSGMAAAERVRFASVASTCAAPRLRVALEAVGEEDEERIAEAVGELARERVAVRRG